jgi:hypothetical protein
MVATGVVERAKATGKAMPQDEMTYKFFVSRLPELHDFPESFAAMQKVLEAFYESGGLQDVAFDEKRHYTVQLAVYAVVHLGKLKGLSRCAHLNNRIVDVKKVTTYCSKAKAGACTHAGECEYKISVEAQLYEGEGLGNEIRVDMSNIAPFLGVKQRAALEVLKSVSTLWISETPVRLHFQETAVSITRFATEVWHRNAELLAPAPDVADVTKASYLLDLDGCAAYMDIERDWSALNETLVVADLRAFVKARLLGFNLCAECPICFEPLREMPQLRLGCACGPAGAVKGRVVHMACAHKWLCSQGRMWQAAFNAHDPAPREGPPGPTCCVCLQRLLGVAPRISDLTVQVPAEEEEGHLHLVNVPSTLRTFFLYHDIDRGLWNLPDDVDRARGNAVGDRVDQSFKYGIVVGRLQDPFTKAEYFPTAMQLFSCNGDESFRECVSPGPAKRVGTQEDDLQSVYVERYNVQVYYAALGCWLRWNYQFRRNGLAAAPAGAEA